MAGSGRRLARLVGLLIVLLTIGASLCNFLDFEDLVAGCPEERVSQGAAYDDDSLRAAPVAMEGPPEQVLIPKLALPAPAAAQVQTLLRRLESAPRPEPGSPARAPQVTRRGPPRLLHA